MKKAISMIVALTMVLALGGCGGKASSAAANASAAGTATSAASSGTTGNVPGTGKLQEILKRGTIRVGLSLNGYPIGSRDDKGNPIGYDVDWAQNLADTLGVKMEVVDVDTDTRISAVASGRVDIIFSNITGTLERAKTIDFSIPYLITGTKMLTLAGCKYKTVDDLNSADIKVAVARGSVGEDLCHKRAPKASLIFVGNFNEALLQVQQGKAAACFEDSSVTDYTAAKSDGKLVSQETRYGTDPICAGMAKGDMEWVYYVNMFISRNITNGWMAETYKKYWGEEPAEMSHPW
ncbi:MAG: transporter substrate-binding domain-containing protein [Bacillota bacterium]|nr:transporter substrate-binding domain-containing protein [Bacillota bacterium]